MFSWLFDGKCSPRCQELRYRRRGREWGCRRCRSAHRDPTRRNSLHRCQECDTSGWEGHRSSSIHRHWKEPNRGRANQKQSSGLCSRPLQRWTTCKEELFRPYPMVIRQRGWGSIQEVCSRSTFHWDSNEGLSGSYHIYSWVSNGTKYKVSHSG